MPGLILWKNQEISKLRRDMDRLIDRLLDEFRMPLLPRTFKEVPFIDLSETEDSLILKAEVPGIKPEDIEISIRDDVLTIKGEIRQELDHDGENYYRTERRYGSFSRKLQLPCRVTIEDVEATYNKGILNIVMPKCKPDKAREIKIKLK